MRALLAGRERQTAGRRPLTAKHTEVHATRYAACRPGRQVSLCLTSTAVPTARYVMRSATSDLTRVVVGIAAQASNTRRASPGRNVNHWQTCGWISSTKRCARAPHSGSELVPENLRACTEFWARVRARKVARLRRILGSISYPKSGPPVPHSGFDLVPEKWAARATFWARFRARKVGSISCPLSGLL